ncbi:MAG: DNA polymerase III subunit gamma/tau, partial [bacterium]
VIEIDGASNNHVDNIRDLRDNVRYAPTRGKFKIYIIDEVHMLSASAFNALLKTLEEPPAHVKFIFATTEAQKVLPTILSRCQRFDLKRISETDIATHLGKIAKLEGITVDESALRLLARQAEGGLRDAESSLDQLISFCGKKIEEKDVLQIFGLTSGEEIRRMAEAALEGNGEEALKQARSLIHADKDLTRLTQSLLRYFRHMLLTQVSPDIAREELSTEEWAYFSSLKTKPTRSLLLAFIEELIQLEGKLRFALVKEAHFEIALLRLVEQREKISLEETLKILTGAKTATTNAPTPQPAKAPEKPLSHPSSPASVSRPPVQPSPQAAAKKAAPLDKAEFLNDPLIKAAVEQFDARLVQVKSTSA